LRAWGGFQQIPKKEKGPNMLEKEGRLNETRDPTIRGKEGNQGKRRGEKTPEVESRPGDALGRWRNKNQTKAQWARRNYQRA